jgi:hypothetical protein
VQRPAGGPGCQGAGGTGRPRVATPGAQASDSYGVQIVQTVNVMSVVGSAVWITGGSGDADGPPRRETAAARELADRRIAHPDIAVGVVAGVQGRRIGRGDGAADADGDERDRGPAHGERADAWVERDHEGLPRRCAAAGSAQPVLRPRLTRLCGVGHAKSIAKTPVARPDARRRWRLESPRPGSLAGPGPRTVCGRRTRSPCPRRRGRGRRHRRCPSSPGCPSRASPS